tara:strand:- start:73 stop:357 length:285 start_codon:yes stop_codon:yes gene_type:complete
MALPKHMQKGYRPGRKPLSGYERQQVEDIYVKPYRERQKGKAGDRSKQPPRKKNMTQLLEAMLADNRAAKEAKKKKPKVPVRRDPMSGSWEYSE